MNARVEDLFHDVADLSAEDRGRYFAEHGVDEETRREVEALLRFDSGASAFLIRDISIAASRALPQLETSGLQCGPYRLKQMVGRGGMGAVYLAERADGEVTQRAAIKLLPPGAGGLQHERFLQERQILAMLTHPNIAHLLDAGHLENGQPFLAMEYVEGQPIDVFAAELGMKHKIALFIKVCSAVAYLHRNLIVHRDLKPGNILVTVDGEPKLLDFGIAKLLDLSTDSTMTSMRMLTPDYASPEQVMGGRVSTATDIYSLGAVLYRLLTNKPAHEFGECSAEAIASTVSGREVTRPSKWVPDLKGDLEAILLKTLRKDPQERYATVEQFAEDLQAFLETRAVRARSGNTWYRARRFLRRYWMPATTAAVLIVGLAASLYVVNRQRAIAERRFGQLRQLSHQVLFDLDTELGSLPGAINARRKLIATSTQYLAGLGKEAAGDRQLAMEVAEAYIQVARIQGVAAWNNLGEYDAALESLGKAETFLDVVLTKDTGNQNALWLSLNAAHDRSSIGNRMGRPDQVLAGASLARHRLAELARLRNLTRRQINGMTYMSGDLAEHQNILHRFEDAARFARAGIDISSAIATVPGPRAQAFSMLATALRGSGDLAGASAAIDEARKQYDKLRKEQGSTAYSRAILALTSVQEGLLLGEDGGVNLNRIPEAMASFRRAFDALEQTAAHEPKDYHTRASLAEPGRYLGDILRHSNPKQALEVYDHTLTRVREIPNDIGARRDEAFLLAGSSYAARGAHQEKDAESRIAAAFAILRDTKDYPADAIKLDSPAEVAVLALADHFAETGRPERAAQTYEELRRKIIASKPDVENDLMNAAYFSVIDDSYAAVLRRVGRGADAEAIEKSRADLWKQWERKLPDNALVRRQASIESAR